ncbi:YdeI/OmpD-associated family protein [Desulfolucanica intricata]|uniref:YdeI/OmpD-associated family protein n=1 Tax=Desulfolucanica intricata TaxID=1285191 RepID=UPI00082C704C|nr:YdeI/OmpD-associated family protein [Desulfolucanica intricata]
MDAALAKKLMLNKFSKILLQNKPEGITEFEGLNCDTTPSGRYDLVFAFVFNLDEMKNVILQTNKDGLLNDGGYLYLAYPKKGNKAYPEYIDRDSIFPHLGVNEDDGLVNGTTLKFSKMLSFNDVFTVVGLKRLVKKADSKSRISARVDDYIEKIPSLREALGSRPEILALYDALPYGYQKDWARQIYSAQTEATREKRLLEMADILAAGYKSKNLYRQGKK